MDLRLRKAEARDQVAVCSLATLLAGLEADRRGVFAAVLSNSNHDLIVAEVASGVIGFAHLATGRDFFANDAFGGQLLGLVVREDHRGRGIGRALLGEVMRLAKLRGIRELHINTELDNLPAQRLYKSIGCEVVGVHMEVDLGKSKLDACHHP